MVWDGDCGFCKLCADRFSYYKCQSVELIPYQSLYKIYPDAPKKDFSKSVFLFTPRGNIYKGAEAVFRFFSESPWIGWTFKLYQKSKLFSVLSEWGYRFVADHRKQFSWLVNLFWGKSFIPSTFQISGWIYARALAVTVLFAFISLWSQALGLIGSEGIIPFQEHLNYYQDNFLLENNFSKWFLKPTLLWFVKGDLGLDILFFFGVIASLFLFFGFIPHVCSLVIWFCYLSFVVVSRPFLNFQWDLLLLEVVLVSFLFFPWVTKEKVGYFQQSNSIGRWLVWLLLFKLMFESGVVKFTYFGADGSNHWIDLSALNFHFWTQPIPTKFSWYFHWLPNWFHKTSLVITYLVELILPFFIFFPRRFRNISCAGIIFLQVMIMITGNYGFFNLLTIGLSLTLIDDQTIPVVLKKYFKKLNSNIRVKKKRYLLIKNFLCFSYLIMFFITGIFYLKLDFKGNRNDKLSRKTEPSFLTDSAVQAAQVSRSMNSYGLFRVITHNRPEIIISYSTDRQNWNTYHFSYKPDDLNKAPSFFLPHMPRLDWQLWFEGLYIERIMKSPTSLELYKRFLEVMVNTDVKLGNINLENFFTKTELLEINNLDKNYRELYIKNCQFYLNNYIDHSYWFGMFLRGLKKGNSDILSLISEDTIEINNPNWLRVELYYYNFSNPDEKEKGDWWSREKIKEVSFDISLKDK